MSKRSIPWVIQPQYPVFVRPELAHLVSSARLWSLPPGSPSEAVQNALGGFTKNGTIDVIPSIGGVGVKGDGTTGHYSRLISVYPQAMWFMVQFLASAPAAGNKTIYSLCTGGASGSFARIAATPTGGIITNFATGVGTSSGIAKEGGTVTTGRVHTVIAVFPSNLNSEAYFYINGIKVTADSAGTVDANFTAVDTYLNEAVGCLKRATALSFSTDTVLLTARGLDQIPEALVQQISVNPYKALLQPRQRNIYVSVAGGPVDYSLTCDTGAYTYTGQLAALSVAHTLTCNAGGYSYAGLNAVLTVKRSLACASGAYVYSGISASLSVKHSLACASGSYSYSGVAATLSVKHVLLCDAGAYTYAGVAATLTYIPGDGTVDYVLACAVGAYAYSGQSATLSVNHNLTCAAGAYSYSGVSASLQVAHRLTCAAGAYGYAGQSATLSVKRNLACATGTYDYIGNTATLDYLSGAASINYVLTCSAGAYTYTGQSATLTVVGSWAGEPFNFASPITRNFDFTSSITKTLAFDSSI